MKSKEEFNSFYTAQLKKLIDQLEVKRKVVADNYSFKKYWRNLKYIAIVCVLVMIIRSFIPNIIPAQVVYCIPATILYAIIAAIVIAVKRDKAFKPINLEYKQTVIPKIIAFLDPNLTYKPADGILNEEFNNSDLFTRPSKFKSEDMVLGKIDGLDIRLSDVHATRTQSNGKSSSQVTVFMGLYAIILMSRNFPSRLAIQPENIVATALSNFARNLVGDDLVDKLGQKFNLGDIELGNSEFDKLFTLRCSDQGLVKNLLTPPFVQLIVAFTKELNAPVSLAFFDNQMHVAISGINLFETNSYQSITESDVSRLYFNALNLTMGVAKAVEAGG